MVEAVERRGAVSIRVDDESGTKAVARRFAALVRRGDVIGLSGPLGSGKTAFARALIRTLTRAEEEVPSPTFTLVQRYESAAVGAIFHFDLYRLEDPEEIWELGIEEAVTEGVVLIEWPERLGALRSADFLDIVLAADPDGREDARDIRFTAQGAWRERLPALTAAPDTCGSR
jgi:tRNA threonylcarbamoyladenosine biosynthesis protein TsaE